MHIISRELFNQIGIVVSYKWTIIPLALAIIGCTEDKNTEPTPNYRNFTISGDVFGDKSNQGNVVIRAGDTVLATADISEKGEYNLPVAVEDSIYQNLQAEAIYLISTNGTIQLANYLDMTLSEAIMLGNLSGNLSSLSTSQYIVADTNDNGIISKQEWVDFSKLSDSDTVNSSIMQFSASLQTVLEGHTQETSSGSLSWLTSLKSSYSWKNWSNSHADALNQTWPVLFENPLADEADTILNLGTGVLDDWFNRDEDVLGDKPARCDLTIIPPNDIDPHNGRVGDQWSLESTLVDQVTGIVISEQNPSWTSNNPNVASVTSNGTVTLNRPGSTNISASFSYAGDDCVDSFAVTVFERDEIVEIEDIRIAIDANEISIGDEIPLTANAYWSNDTASDVSNVAIWTVEPAESAEIKGQWLKALKAGDLEIRASYEGKHDVKNITVLSEDITPPELESLLISGYVGPKKEGESWHLNATGHYDDDTSRDLTALARWSTTDDVVANVTAGIVTALKPGKATISALVDGIESTQEVVVLDDDIIEPEIVSISIVGDTSDKVVGDSWTVTAMAKYDDDEEYDVTTQVQWSSSDSHIMLVHQGSIQAVGEGTASISISLDDLSHSQTITVEPYEADLIDVEMVVGEESIFVGATAHWQLSAKYDDDTESNVSDLAQWSTSNEEVATVANGVITAHSVGSVTITGEFEGKLDSAELEVKVISVESIVMSGGSQSIRVGDTTTYSAMAHYNNGTQSDVTDSAQWNSASDSHAVSVDGGVVTGINVGSAEIVVELEGESDSSQVTVTTDAPQINGVEIKGDTGNLEKNEARQLQAAALFDNDSSIVVIAEWTSSNPSIISVDAAGVMMGNELGKATITALYQGQESTIEIEVISDDPILESIEINGDVSHFRKGDILQLTATAHYDRGDSQDITQDVAWRTTNELILSIEHGLIEGVSPGNANIIAEFSGEGASLPVMVLLPDVVSIKPSIFDNEMTMTEGEIHDGQFVLTFSDGTVEDYSDEVSYSTGSTTDSSSLRIVNVLEGGFRSYRAGDSSVKVSLTKDSDVIEHLRHAGIEVSGSTSYPSVNIELEVEANPDTYMWHRINTGSEENHTQQFQVFLDEKVYQFWNHVESSVLKGIYVTHFDGEVMSEPKLILEDLKVTNSAASVMYDGGGNGFVFLQVENANRIKDQYVYDIAENKAHLIDFSSIDTFNSISVSSNYPYSFTEEGKFNYHYLTGSSNSRKLVVYQYDFNVKVWTVLVEHDLEHPYNMWVHTIGQNTHYIMMDYLGYNSSSAGYRPLELHFYNRNTGELDRKVKFVHPTAGKGTHCSNITYSNTTQFQIRLDGDIISAMCVANVSSGNDERWIWKDITKFPEIFTRDEREVWASNSQINIARAKDKMIGFGASYKDSPGNTWREILEWDTFELEQKSIQLPTLSSRNINNELSSTYRNYDVSNLSLSNPYVENDLLVLAYGTLNVVDTDSYSYADDHSMYGLPTNLGTSNRPYKIGDTWYIFGGHNSYSQYNYFWRLQLRNPEADLH
ncbi:Ig-like domain-containing protein [Vibrio sp. FNV 38]|nr:Ig-like domain-containing protein [Vibrio sp. FNV 38]